MAIHFEEDKIKREIKHLKHNLNLQNVSFENFTVFMRLEDQKFLYLYEDEEIQIIDNEALKEKSSLIFRIFKEKKDRDVIVISQPFYAMQMLAEKKDVKPVLDDLPQMVGMKCKVCPGNESDIILKTLQKNDAVLLYNFNLNQNGLLVLSPSIERALAAILIVEKSSQAMIESKIIGGAKPLPHSICRFYRNNYLNNYSKVDKQVNSQNADDIPRPIDEDELCLRQQLVDYGIALLENNLTLGTWGNLSLRLDENYMLITPSAMAYDRLTPYDMVRVNCHTLEYEGRLKPSVETGFHAAIYVKHKAIGGIIHTHSFNGSVFAAANQAMPIVMPEAIPVLGPKTGYVPYHKAGTEELAKAVTEAITEDVWSAIMGSHGMVCCGKDLPDTFNRIKLMDKAARYYFDMHSA